MARKVHNGTVCWWDGVELVGWILTSRQLHRSAREKSTHSVLGEENTSHQIRLKPLSLAQFSTHTTRRHKSTPSVLGKTQVIRSPLNRCLWLSSAHNRISSKRNGVETMHCFTRTYTQHRKKHCQDKFAAERERERERESERKQKQLTKY